MVQVAIASFRQQYNGSWNYIMAASTVVALPTIVDVRHLPEAHHRVDQDERHQVSRTESNEASGMTERFSGLGLHLGNLSRLSSAQVPFDQPGEIHRREGQRRHGRRGHRRDPRARARPRLEDFAVDARRAGRDACCSATSRARARSSKSGSRRPTCAGAISSCASTGTARSTRRSRRRSAISSPAAGAATRR